MQKAQTAADEASLEAIAVAQGQVSITENEANEAKTAVATAQSAEKNFQRCSRQIYNVDGKVVALTTQEKAIQTNAEKQVPVQEVYSLPETGEVTIVGLAFLGLFMTLLAFLGFVDRHTRRN
ncbi:hypothetical protein X839_00815 [Streptococcus thermophilus MTH17CL396]|uniref:LPXTG cell wall anchor domain-containing protein n=1 Tax=Streptococcus thermophilus TaxID=1308 RepID=UPI0003E5C0FD|nr:LPXTG cell wall anchor domain-containing protein [Streptococcus thermophilus]ETW91417.1 hypothetical protein X839_00815 [Streptococcus thermophilus MTH17CL396]